MHLTISDSPAVHSATLVPAAPDHFVHFYSDESDLIGNVAPYIRHGLEAGCGAVVICTAHHRTAIEAQWRAGGFETSSRRGRGQLVILDAAETLGKFMTAAGPDPQLFEMVIGGTMSGMLGRWGEVVAFGEMVALLWVQGRPEHSIALENLWNDLSRRKRFALYCAYPQGACGTSDATHFRSVCQAHSHLMTATPVFGAGPSEADQLLLIADLQQKAAALDNELKLRREAEERLRQREAEVADFLENGVVGMHRVGPDGTILWANRAELQMLGYAPYEYIGHHISKFHVDRGLLERILEALASGGQLQDQAAQMICKDGSVRHVLINSNAQMEGGRFVATRCFTRDVTERWLAQEALRERSAILHLALQGARSGFWVLDLEQRVVRCSHELVALLGAPGLLECGLDAFVDMMHVQDRGAFLEAVDQALADKAMFSCEFRIAGNSRGARWFEARGEAVWEADGGATRFYGICTEITGRREQERMLEHYGALIASAQDAILSKSLDGTILSWNPAATRLFGFQPNEILGRSIRELIPPDLQAEEDALMARLRSGETIERYATRRISKEGAQRHVCISISPVRGRNGDIVGASTIVAAAPDSKPPQNTTSSA